MQSEKDGKNCMVALLDMPAQSLAWKTVRNLLELGYLQIDSESTSLYITADGKVYLDGLLSS